MKRFRGRSRAAVTRSFAQYPGLRDARPGNTEQSLPGALWNVFLQWSRSCEKQPE